MAIPTTRYVRGLFNREKLTPAQALTLDLAIAALDGLAREGAIAFAVVEDPKQVSAGGRKPRRDRKAPEERSIGPTERINHALLSARGPMTLKQISAANGREIASTRSSIFYLHHAGFAERTNPKERVAIWRVTDKPMPERTN